MHRDILRVVKSCRQHYDSSGHHIPIFVRENTREFNGIFIHNDIHQSAERLHTGLNSGSVVASNLGSETVYKDSTQFNCDSQQWMLESQLWDGTLLLINMMRNIFINILKHLRKVRSIPLTEMGKKIPYHVVIQEICNKNHEKSRGSVTGYLLRCSDGSEINASCLVVSMLLAYSLVLLSNLSCVQRTYVGLWRPNEHCDY